TEGTRNTSSTETHTLVNVLIRSSLGDKKKRGALPSNPAPTYNIRNVLRLSLFGSVTGVLVGILFLSAHFEGVDLTLRNRTKVVIWLDAAVHHLFRMVALCRSAELILGR